MNIAENIPLDNLDRHGGSDIVGGSPRKMGTKLMPEKIIKIMNKTLEEKDVFNFYYFC